MSSDSARPEQTERPEGPADSRTAAVAILGTGSYLPSHVVTNDEVGGPAGVDDAWITRKTGIRERRFAKDDEATSDMAAIAARSALEDAGVSAAQLTQIIVATSTPDSPQPATAAHVARHLDAPPTAAAFDLNAVCSGFTYALAMAHRVAAADGGYALVIGADMYSRYTDPADRRTRVLLGDGAGAVVVGPSSGPGQVLATRLLNFSEGLDLVKVPAGGTRLGTSYATVDDGLHYFAMDGRGVVDIVRSNLPGLLSAFLDDAGVSKEDIAHIVPHQGNAVMLQTLEQDLAFPRARMHATAPFYGNTGAASIPVTLDDAVRAGALREGGKVLLTAFGGGFTFGFVLIDW